jgi:hypothetical protein
MRVPLGQFAAARKSGTSAHGNVGVLAHEQCIEAARFEFARQFSDIYAVVSGKDKNANQHSKSQVGCLYLEPS